MFYTNDKTYYTSPWFGGQAPDHDPVRLHARRRTTPPTRAARSLTSSAASTTASTSRWPCGTKLYAARQATVVEHVSLGSAYGTNPLLLHTDRWDLVIGHTRKRSTSAPATRSSRDS